MEESISNNRIKSSPSILSEISVQSSVSHFTLCPKLPRSHVWVSMAFRSHFSISRHQMKHYFVHNVLLYCNKYLFIPTLYGNLKFHNYSIYTIPNTACSESFTESHPILRKDKFTTNINLWQFSVLNRSINSTLTLFIIKLAYNNYQFLSFILSCFQDNYRVHLKSYQREVVSKKFTAKVLPTENLDRW